MSFCRIHSCVFSWCVCVLCVISDEY